MYESLLALALTEFGTLTPAERELMRSVRSDQIADLRSGDPAADDCEISCPWGDARTIRSQVLRWLLVSPSSQPYLPASGVWVAGARITGRFDLSYCRVAVPVVLLHCVVDSAISFEGARLRQFRSFGTRFASVAASGVEIGGDLQIRSSWTSGEVNLIGATIKGQLSCRGGQFENAGGNALNADRLSVDGSVFLNERFQAQGEVRLLGATIKGQLACRGGQFENPTGNSLVANGIAVSDAVFLDGGMKVNGTLLIEDATFSRGVTINGLFSASQSDATQSDAIHFGGSHVGGNLELRATGISGMLNMQRTRIDGDLTLDAIEIDLLAVSGINLQQARVRGTLSWKNVIIDDAVTVDLSHARVTRFDSDYASGWPVGSALTLDGFTYDDLTLPAGNDRDFQSWVNTKLTWIASTGTYRSQSYECFIRFLRSIGHEDDARTVSIARQRSLRHRGGLSRWGRARNWFWDWSLRYGYRLWRPIIPGAVLVLVGILAYRWGWNAGYLAPTASQPEGTPAYHPWFNPVVYSLDTFLPIVDLRQQTHWEPLARGWQGWGLLAFFWFQIGVGWLVSTLLVLGISGLVRKD